MTHWRTSTVVQLCESMRQAQDYSACPILADALQDAGYPHDEELAQFRDPHSPRWLAERLVACVYSDEAAAAVKWVDKYAADLGTTGGYPNIFDDSPMTYDVLMDAAHEFATTGEVVFNSMDLSNASCDPEYEEFWKLYGVITGAPIPDTTGEFFSCSC